ncbi:hypothetical protein [Tsukamurella soli]|uniref:hypothetical protein n=1 Tax=Tsukamurella soli TaxID=644556 RepID=UPI00361A6A92
MPSAPRFPASPRRTAPSTQPWVVPIPGTRRTARIEENARATGVPLSADELADLESLAASACAATATTRRR